MSEDNTAKPATVSAAQAFQKAPSSDHEKLLSARRQARSLRESRKEGTAERERVSSLGGLTLQLHVDGELPGYKLIWENNDNGAIETRLMQGFDFVTQDELYQKTAKVVPDEDIDSALTRFVKGTRSDGQALRAYLLKCPDDLWREIEEERHSAADKWDEDIRRQANSPDEKAGMRKLRNLNSEIDTQYKKEYSIKR